MWFWEKSIGKFWFRHKPYCLIMVLGRDRQLDLAARKKNNLRVERYRRLISSSTFLLRFLLLAMLKDSGTSDFTRSLIRLRYNRFNVWQRQTTHRSRCWESGRARGVKRSTLLARMHLRTNMAQGYLSPLRLTRT